MTWSPDNSRLPIRIPGEGGSTLWEISSEGKTRLVLKRPGLSESATPWIGKTRFSVMAANSDYGSDRGLHLLDTGIRNGNGAASQCDPACASVGFAGGFPHCLCRQKPAISVARNPLIG